MTSLLLLALVPIVLFIAFGAWLKHTGFLAESFWPQAERLGYYLLLPALFFHSLATARLGNLPVRGMVAVLVLSTLVVATLVVSLRRALPVTNAEFTSLFQGSVRFNNYVGVSAAVGIWGAQGLAMAAVANAAIVPTVNILCVLVFAHYGHAERPSLLGILKQLALNPLVMACFLAIPLQVAKVGLPPGIEPAFKAVGQASLPLGLICVGAALNFSAVRQWLRPIGFSSVAKFLVMPLVTFGACRLLHLRGDAAVAALLFQTLPTASSSYIMARQLGGDAPLMAGIIAGQTLLAGLALPAMLMAMAAWI